MEILLLTKFLIHFFVYYFIPNFLIDIFMF